jgi:hypothetical protein
VITQIDIKYGLEMPLFIFAFSKMRRGISYRSSKRVPTHIVILLGRGHNASNVVQAMGRATGNWKSVLESNGFNHSKILTASNDYTMAMKVDAYNEEVSRRVKDDGKSFYEAMTGADEKMPDAANFLRHTFREIGQLKGQRASFKKLVNFVEPEDESLTPDEKNAKTKFWEDAEAQRLLRTLLELSKYRIPVMVADIDEAYNDTFRDDRPKIKPGILNKLLRQFMDDALISKEEKTSHDEENSYSVNNPKGLRQCIHDKLALTKKETGEGWELEELLGMHDADDLSTDNQPTISNYSKSSLSTVEASVVDCEVSFSTIILLDNMHTFLSTMTDDLCRQVPPSPIPQSVPRGSSTNGTPSVKDRSSNSERSASYNATGRTRTEPPGSNLRPGNIEVVDSSDSTNYACSVQNEGGDLMVCHVPSSTLELLWFVF